MQNERSDIDPGGLLEYSVVFSDRSLNHMSQSFQEVMRDISATLKKVYKSQSVVLVPGGGTCLLYTSPSPRDRTRSRMPSSA